MQRLNLSFRVQVAAEESTFAESHLFQLVFGARDSCSLRTSARLTIKLGVHDPSRAWIRRKSQRLLLPCRLLGKFVAASSPARPSFTPRPSTIALVLSGFALSQWTCETWIEGFGAGHLHLG